jgi:hypothetical protein
MKAVQKIEFEKRPRAARLAAPGAATPCAACNSMAGYRTVLVTKEVELKDESLPVTYECQECARPGCGHRLLSAAQMEQRLRRTVAAYQDKHGLLTAQEIADRRKALGLATQQALADAAPEISIATLKRVEAGQHVQDPGTDTLLRLALDKLEAEKKQSQLRDFLRADLPSAMGVVTISRGKAPKPLAATAWRGAWAAFPLAACVTVVASTRSALIPTHDSFPPGEVAPGC